MPLDQSATPESFRTVHCARHGDRREAFVCEHLLHGHNLGFFTEDATSPCPDAWCSSCERIRSEAGGWNDDSESRISVKLVCSDCYEEMKARNIRPDEGQSSAQ